MVQFKSVDIPAVYMRIKIMPKGYASSLHNLAEPSGSSHLDSLQCFQSHSLFNWHVCLQNYVKMVVKQWWKMTAMILL